MDRLGPTLLVDFSTVFALCDPADCSDLQDVQPEKGPVDLRLGADLSLDSRLARVA